MRHAVLGAGGIGGLIGAALARAGAEALLLLRPATLASYRGRVTVESVVLGEFEVEVPATASLDSEVDVLWVTTKATALEAALPMAPPERVGTATVIPLLNGVDHVAALRERYPNVVAAAIRVESERVSPGRIRQSSPFLRVELAGAEAIARDLQAAGIDARVRDDEVALLWDKLVVLAPVALATTALDAPFGGIRDDRRYRDCLDETLAVARALGADVDEAGHRAFQQTAPDQMRSSMQKDVAAGRSPELDAIAGPILRGAEQHGIPVPATRELAELVTKRSVG